MNTRTGADVVGAEGEQTRARLMRLSAVLILVNGALLAPWWVLGGGLRPPWMALEAVAVTGTFAVLPCKKWTAYAALGAAAVVVLSTIVGLGDTAMRLSLGRPLNLYVDLWLLASVWDLVRGTLGPAPAAATVVLVPVAAIGLTGLLAYLLASIRPDRSPLSARSAALAVVSFAAAALVSEHVPGVASWVDAPTARLARDQTSRFVETLNERAWFAEALETSRDSYADVPGLLSRLDGRDVIFGFIESYGVAALYDPRYASVVGPRLDDFEERVGAAGLHMVSGKLVAPSQGGQSWFGHGSMLSGIWLDTQLRYDMMLASGRETLIDDFRRAGHRTVAVMPAITQAWPEGRRFGYDEIYTAGDIDYAGPPLNWVTMPDQFTWSFFEKRVRGAGEEALFAELSLISSHAPWTPILPVLDDWDSIGDGSVFAKYADAGERPDELWRDTERVREHYALSVEYALHVMAAYAERYVDDRTLLVVLGDHQPAPLITGEGVTWEVPVHVVSGDRALLEPFLDWGGFVEGAWPGAGSDPETLGVDYFRDWFVRAYSAK